MKKKAPQRSIILYAFQYPILLLIATLFVATLNASKIVKTNASEDGAVLGRGKSKNVNKGSSNKPDKDVGKPENPGNKNKDKPNKGQGSPNAALHKQKVLEVVGNLNEISEEEEQVGNEETADEIEEVAVEEEEGVNEVTEAIQAVETRPKWKTLLFGSDYKNLGQLRSHLAHNTNSIRKLSKAQNKVQAQGNEEEVQAQLGELLQERERIRAVITEHEDDFGILGWVFRFLNGYVGGETEDDLSDYVDVPESTESDEEL